MPHMRVVFLSLSIPMQRLRINKTKIILDSL
jgi:hypothetical protein